MLPLAHEVAPRVCFRDRVYSDRDGVVALAPGTERELADQQADGEPDAGQDGQAEHVKPGQVGVQLGLRQAGDEPGCGEDAERLADEQADHDADRDAV